MPLFGKYKKDEEKKKQNQNKNEDTIFPGGLFPNSKKKNRTIADDMEDLDILDDLFGD